MRFFKKIPDIYSLSNIKSHTRVLHTTRNRHISPKKRVSLCILKRKKAESPRRLKKASLTLEASLIVPLFMMAVICIASIMGIYSKTLSKMITLRNATEQTALLASAVDRDVWIDISQPMMFQPLYLPDNVFPVMVWVRGRARSWVGRDAAAAASAGEQAAETYVYLTEHASVYHTSSSCSHLDLSIHPADSNQLAFLRNEYGAKYKPCEKCAAYGTASGTVYITDDGDRYHTSLSCSGLKRTVRMVGISEADGLQECSRCAAHGS